LFILISHFAARFLSSLNLISGYPTHKSANCLPLATCWLLPPKKLPQTGEITIIPRKARQVT